MNQEYVGRYPKVEVVRKHKPQWKAAPVLLCCRSPSPALATPSSSDCGCGGASKPATPKVAFSQVQPSEDTSIPPPVLISISKIHGKKNSGGCGRNETLWVKNKRGIVSVESNILGKLL